MTGSSPTLADLAPALAGAFREHDYSVPGLEVALGPDVVAALGRSDAPAVRRSARDAGPVGLLIRLFVLGDTLPAEEIAAVLPAVDPTAGVDAGLWARADDDPARLHALIDLRPVDTGHGTRWVFSDIDGSMVRVTTRPDHVLGVGQATLSLLRITPTSPTGSVLDLGTGCGIQLVHALAGADSATGTDITPRCLELAAATLAVNDLDAELLTGSWFEPVAGRRFDRVVANPPFVVGAGEAGHSYRESGLALDGASATVVAGAPEHLTEDGTAVLLVSWVERDGEDWRSRVASWVPTDGVDAWVLRRDVSDPALYVWTWLTDEGADPRDASTARAADDWLDHFAAEGVTGVGFGYVYLRRIDGPSSVLCEDLTHPFDDGLGDEAEAYFARTAWLRAAAATHGDEAAALDATVLTVSPDVRLHVSEPLGPAGGGDRDGMDGSPAAEGHLVVVERVTGARWRHEIDPVTASVLRGARTGALPLADLMVLAAAGAGEDPDELPAPLRRVFADLFLHGFVVPVGVPGLIPAAASAVGASGDDR